MLYSYTVLTDIYKRTTRTEAEAFPGLPHPIQHNNACYQIDFGRW